METRMQSMWSEKLLLIEGNHLIYQGKASQEQQQQITGKRQLSVESTWLEKVKETRYNVLRETSLLHFLDDAMSRQQNDDSDNDGQKNSSEKFKLSKVETTTTSYMDHNSAASSLSESCSTLSDSSRRRSVGTAAA
mmetsp:Transcript_28838/g.43547  ORF Transcript_28838/g.43547 Transcript_28838/m.43547 type:complete len:136 (+) Transcript_28838:115-522(+)